MYEPLTRAEIIELFSWHAMVELPDGYCRKPTPEECFDPDRNLPNGARVYRRMPLSSKRSVWGRRENSTISAILLFHRLFPWSMEQVELCLYENPWAHRPIPVWLKQVFPFADVKEVRGIQYLHWPSDQLLSSLRMLTGVGWKSVLGSFGCFIKKEKRR